MMEKEESYELGYFHKESRKINLDELINRYANKIFTIFSFDKKETRKFYGRYSLVKINKFDGLPYELLKEISALYLKTFLTGESGIIWGNNYIYDDTRESVINYNGKVIIDVNTQIMRFMEEYNNFCNNYFVGYVILDDFQKSKVIGCIYGYSTNIEKIFKLFTEKLKVSTGKLKNDFQLFTELFYLSNFFIEKTLRKRGIGKIVLISFFIEVLNKKNRFIVLRTHIKTGLSFILNKYFKKGLKKIYDYGDGRIIYLIDLEKILF